jgi:hypothetical protein
MRASPSSTTGRCNRPGTPSRVPLSVHNSLQPFLAAGSWWTYGETGIRVVVEQGGAVFRNNEGQVLIPRPVFGQLEG